MKDKFKNHPAVILGKWLKDKRIERGLTLRIFAEKLGLAPAIACDMGFGINMQKNLTDRVFNQICQVLELAFWEREEFEMLRSEAISEKDLKMEDLFTREEMMPAFPFRLDEKTGKLVNFTEEQLNNLVDRIFEDRKP